VPPVGTVSELIKPGNAKRENQAVHRDCVVRKLLVVFAVVAPEMLTIEFIDAIHGGRSGELVFANFTCRLFGLKVGQTIDSDGTRIDKFDREAIPP